MAKEDRIGNGRSEGRPADFLGLGAFATPPVEAAVRAGNLWIKGLGSLNEEMISFSQQQITKAMEASQSLMQCSSVDQAIEKQQELARGTIESYAREATKLLDLTSDLARKAWAQAERPGSSAAAGED